MTTPELYECCTCGHRWAGFKGRQNCPKNPAHLFIVWLTYGHQDL